MKNTKIPGRENATLGIGFQFFNLFNHPNFGFPDNFSSDPTFGEIFYLEQPLLHSAFSATASEGAYPLRG